MLSPSPDITPHWGDDMLREVAETCMLMTRVIRRRVERIAEVQDVSPDADVDIGSLDVKLARVARAVRQTVALSRKLEDRAAEQRLHAQRRADTISMTESVRERHRKLRVGLQKRVIGAAIVSETISEDLDDSGDLKDLDRCVEDWTGDPTNHLLSMISYETPLSHQMIELCEELGFFHEEPERREFWRARFAEVYDHLEFTGDWAEPFAGDGPRFQTVDIDALDEPPEQPDPG